MPDESGLLWLKLYRKSLGVGSDQELIWQWDDEICFSNDLTTIPNNTEEKDWKRGEVGRQKGSVVSISAGCQWTHTIKYSWIMFQKPH